MRKNYDILDLTKVILSLMVMAIHTQLFPLTLYPWLRLAVPLFFIISSFLFFSKIKDKTKDERIKATRHYAFRMIKLYLFWSIILLPITIDIRKAWFNNGAAMGIYNIITKPFLGSTFIASWYLAASVLGMIIVEKCSRKFKARTMLVASAVIYLVCCFFSCYHLFLPGSSVVNAISPYIEPQFSFMSSLVFIVLGKMIAENRIKISKKANLALIAIFCMALYTEWFIIRRITNTYNNDCYLMLIPTALLIFNYIRTIRIKLRHPKILRQFSNFAYPLHASVAYRVSAKLYARIHGVTKVSVLNFAITLSICVIVFALVKLFEKKLKFLKYSY